MNSSQRYARDDHKRVAAATRLLRSFSKLEETMRMAKDELGADWETALFGKAPGSPVLPEFGEPDVIHLATVELAAQYLEAVTAEATDCINPKLGVGNLLQITDCDPVGLLDHALDELRVGRCDSAIDYLKAAVAHASEPVEAVLVGRDREVRQRQAQLQRDKLLMASRVCLGLLMAARNS